MKNLIIGSFFFLLFFCKTNASFLFSEIMPNTEDDVNLEYLEIYNNSSETKSLSGYILADKSEKQFIFGDIVFSEHQKIKFYRSETSILLNNSSEEIFLYDNENILVDSFYYETSNKGETIIIYETSENLENEEFIEDENQTPEDTEGSQFYEDNNDDIEITTQENIETNFIIPDFEIEVQSGLDFLEADIWECPEKGFGDCKINLNIENSFENYNLSDFDFLWDFGDAEYTDSTKYKANPCYVTYSDGVFGIIVKVCEVGNKNNCKTKSISIKNIEDENFDEEIFQETKIKKKNKPIVKTKYKIEKPKIIIESGLNEKLECINKNNCNLNFKYEQKTSREKCEWDFGGGEFSLGAKNNCNPSYVQYGTGRFEVSLRVYERGDYFNFSKTKISFTNLFEKQKDVIPNKILDKNKKIETEKLEDNKEENVKTDNDADLEKDIKQESLYKKTILKSIINIQGKIGNNKTLNGNVLTCYENCSVNFDGSNSIGNISRYSWDFGNGERFEGKNPSYINYKYPGKYKIHLLVEGNGTMDIEEFYVNFIGEETEIITENEDESFLLSTAYAGDNTSEYLENTDTYKKESSPNTYNMKQITILLYILIAIFGAILFVLLFKKEGIL